MCQDIPCFKMCIETLKIGIVTKKYLKLHVFLISVSENNSFVRISYRISFVWLGKERLCYPISVAFTAYSITLQVLKMSIYLYNALT
jgi:hypothetical protein